MLAINGAAQKIQVIADVAGDLEVSVAFMDYDASLAADSRVFPGAPAELANITGTAAVDVVPAAGASKSRTMTGLVIRNAHASSAPNVTVRRTDGSITNDFIKWPLLPGEVIVMDEAGMWARLDANGGAYVAGAATRFPSVLMSPHFATANLTSTKTITSASSFAVYVGKADKALASAQVRLRVTTAAATITWAEVALAKGVVNVGGNPILTVVGFADVSAVINSTGQKTVTVNVSAGQKVDAGDDLWILIGNSATTAAQVRAASIADDIQVGVQASVANRPSLIVGVGTAFTIESATALAAWVAAVL